MPLFAPASSAPTTVGVINANAAPYGCTPNSSGYDNAAGIAAALAAAVTGAVSGVGIIEFDSGEYYVNGPLLTTGQSYAQIPLPVVAMTAPKARLIVRPKNRAGSTYTQATQTTAQVGNVVFRSTLTGQVYDATNGHPSVFGGKDPHQAGATAFSNLDVEFQGIRVRQAPNPSLCGLQLQLVAQATLTDVVCDTTESYVGAMTQPTSVTGMGTLMPSNSNNDKARYVGDCAAIGHYAGLGISEHTQTDKLTAYRCMVGLNVQGNYYHAAHVQHASVEHCPYVLGTVTAALGLTTPAGANGFSTINIDLLDIEDANDASWAIPNKHVNDSSNAYYGLVRYTRVKGGVGTQTGALTLNGAGHLTFFDLTRLNGGGDQAWVAPTLLNSWVNFGSGEASAGYRKDALGYVHLQGVVKSGTPGSGTPIFQLPAGYRPAAIVEFVTIGQDGTSSNVGAAHIGIQSTGQVSVVATTGSVINGVGYTSLNIPPFLAEQ